MEQSEIIRAIREKISADTVSHHDYRGDDTLIIRRESLFKVMQILKEEFHFEMLVDICAVDYLGQQPRFEVVYHLNSLTQKVRLRIKVALNEGDEVESVVPIWPIANWLERETWDMMGIKFTNHPDPRRLLMYDEFVGHALRKDYPINKRQPRVKPKHEYR
jgi:NADH-quinone oxidoreductase subunit C